MIREMKQGEEDKVRSLIAKLGFEDQTFWRKQSKSMEELLAESSRIPISREVRGRNVIFVAEEDDMIVGLCWCTIVDRGVDKQGEVAEIYVEEKFRGKRIGRDLVTAAKNLFVDEQVAVAFAWTHHGNEAAIELYRDAGFREVDQLVMAFTPSNERSGVHDSGGVPS